MDVIRNQTPQRGFTFVELVIVVVILGLLAAVAVPRYLSLTDEAKIASVEGIAGGFASGVVLARSQWEVDGQHDSIVLSGRAINMNDFGFPTHNGGAQSKGLNGNECGAIMADVLQSHPSYATDGDLRKVRYYVTAENGAIDGIIADDGNIINNIDLCRYYAVFSLALDDNGKLPAQPSPQDDGIYGFDYNPATGQVTPFIN